MDLDTILCDTEYVTPAAILKAMLGSGWTWSLCPSNLDCYYMKRDGFVYIIQHDTLTWNVVIELFTDYGFYIGRKYAAGLGMGSDGFDSVH